MWKSSLLTKLWCCCFWIWSFDQLAILECLSKMYFNLKSVPGLGGFRCGLEREGKSKSCTLTTAIIGIIAKDKMFCISFIYRIRRKVSFFKITSKVSGLGVSDTIFENDRVFYQWGGHIRQILTSRFRVNVTNRCKGSLYSLTLENPCEKNDIKAMQTSRFVKLMRKINLSNFYSRVNICGGVAQ